MKCRYAHSLSINAALDEVLWLQELPYATRKRVYEDCFETSHIKGETIARHGEHASTWIGVTSGLLKASAVDRNGRSVMFSCVPEGSWVGEGSVIKGEARRYEIVALRKSHLLNIPGSTLRWLMESSIEFNRLLVALLNERLSQFISTISIDRIDDPTARVAKMLTTMDNPILFPKQSPIISMSQSELSELIGLSRQSINVALKNLEAAGLIMIEYGGIVLRDVNGLKEFEGRS